MLVWQRADARREALLATGARAPALLVASRATNTRINNRTVLAHTFEAREAGRVIRAEAKAFVHLPIGAEATIAYDTTDPARAVVVEDLDQVAADGQVDWQTLQQRAVDRRFRRRRNAITGPGGLLFTRSVTRLPETAGERASMRPRACFV